MSNEKNLQELLHKLRGMKAPQEAMKGGELDSITSYESKADSEEPLIPIEKLDLLSVTSEAIFIKYIEQLRACKGDSVVFQKLCNILYKHTEFLAICRAFAALSMQMQRNLMGKLNTPIYRFENRVVINRKTFNELYSWVCVFLNIKENKELADTIWDMVYTVSSNVAGTNDNENVERVFRNAENMEDSEALDYLKDNLGPAIDKTDIPEQAKDNIKEIINKLLNKDE